MNGGGSKHEGVFPSRVAAVEVLAPYRLRTTWNTGDALQVEVELFWSSEIGHRITRYWLLFIRGVSSCRETIRSFVL